MAKLTYRVKDPSAEDGLRNVLYDWDGLSGRLYHNLPEQGARETRVQLPPGVSLKVARASLTKIQGIELLSIE